MLIKKMFDLSCRLIAGDCVALLDQACELVAEEEDEALPPCLCVLVADGVMTPLVGASRRSAVAEEAVIRPPVDNDAVTRWGLGG